MLRAAAVVVASAAMLFHALVLVWVLFFGGVHLELGWLPIDTATGTRPLLSLMATFVMLLVLLRKGREALLFCAATLVAGSMVEGALRATDHPMARPGVTKSWHRPSDGLGHELVPGFEGPGPLSVPLTINSHGFRDVERNWTKGEGAIRILGIGDSFAFGWGVSSEETYLRQLEGLLARATGRKVEAINAAVPGWGLNQYSIYLRRSGVRYAPDVIVIGYFLDDLTGPPLETIAPDLGFSQRATPDGGLIRRVRLYNLSRRLDDQLAERNRRRDTPYLRSLEARRQEWAKRVNHLMVKPDPNTEALYTQLLDQHLARLRGIAEAANASLVVMYIPDVSQLGRPEYQHINRVLGSRTRRHNIPFLDMTPIFESANTVDTFYLWPMDAHTNGPGHAEMGKALSDLLCSCSGVLSVPCVNPLRHPAPCS